MNERNSALDSGKVRYAAQVHDFLHGAGAEEGETGLAAGHDVGVVAEDGERVGRNGTRGHMEDAGEQFARDLIHVREHQQEALGCGIGGGESAGLQRAVDCACGAAFGLHFDDLDGLAEQVLLSVRGHVVNGFRHGR